MKRQPTYIELFAGCGGFSLGMMRAGLKCLAAMEIDWAASYTFWYNLCLNGWSHFFVNPDDERNKKHLHKIKGGRETQNEFFEIPGNDWLYKEEISPCLNLFCMDINQIEPEEFCEIGGFKPEDVDVVCGGPPCQGFSTANSNRSMNDNRNTLPFRFLYYVHKIQPKFFLMENVPGMLTLGKKKGEKHGPFPQWIIETAEKFGYHCEWHIHNACDYGVPQNRKRVVFVGVRQDLYDQGTRYTFPDPTHTYSYFEYLEKGLPLPEDTEPFVTVAEAIGELSDMELHAGEDGGNMVRIDNKYYMPTKAGILEPRGHIGKEIQRLNEEHPGHYFLCPNCGKINIKVRKHCHYCNHKFSPIILLNETPMTKTKTTVKQTEPTTEALVPGVYHCEQPYVGFTGGIISADSEIILIEHWQDLKICLCEFPDDHKRLQIKEAEFRENWKLTNTGPHPTPSMPLPTLETGVLWEAIPQMPVFTDENEATNPLTGTEILEPEISTVPAVQPETSTMARPNAESYPGNKHSAGVPQRLINQIPVHDVRISGFGGKCAVMSYMVPATSNFVVDVNLDALREYWKAFPHVKTERADFLTWIKQFTFSKQTGPRYFIYLDPPYLFSSRRSGAIIYDHEMTDEQHADLIKWAIETTNMSNVMIAISHYPCPEYDQLLKHGWRKLTYQVATHMGTRDESLYMNYPEPAELHDYSFFGDNKITRQAFKRRVTKLVTKFQEIETQERAGLLRALAAQFNISTPPPFTNENEVAV